jgi:hypothetical protein
MWPVIVAAVRRYFPIIVLPVAVVVGAVGYGVEGAITGRKDQEWKTKSTMEERQDRQLELSEPTDDQLKERTFVPRNIFEKNK